MSLIRPHFAPSSLPLGSQEAFAGIEVSSIPRGMVCLDALVKRAEVRVILATAVTPGKFLVLFDGGVAEVEESLLRAEEVAGSQLIDRFFLPNAHPQLEPAVFGVLPSRPEGAVGIIETATACSGLSSADAALKAAQVVLAVLHLSVGIGGKCYYAFVGELYDVEASVKAACDALEGSERLLSSEIIARPHPDFFSGLGI